MGIVIVFNDKYPYDLLLFGYVPYVLVDEFQFHEYEHVVILNKLEDKFVKRILQHYLSLGSKVSFMYQEDVDFIETCISDSFEILEGVISPDLGSRVSLQVRRCTDSCQFCVRSHCSERGVSDENDKIYK